MKRTLSESTALPNAPCAPADSVVKRPHGESIVSEDEEQPAIQARIETLVAGLHGVNAAEDDEVCSGDGFTIEWLSSWYPETHMSQRMVTKANTLGNEKIQKKKGVSCCHQRIHEKGTKRET